MTTTSRIISVEDGLGIVFPEDVLARLQLGIGDDVLLRQTSDGYELISAKQEFGRQMTLARQVIKKRSAALSALAKS